MRVIFRKSQINGSCPEMIEVLTKTENGHDIRAVIHLDLFWPPASNIYRRLRMGEQVECDIVEV